MSRRVIVKWRPPLWFVIAGTLAAVFMLPLLGIAYFRVAGGVLGWAETSWLIGLMAFLVTAILGFLLWRLVLRPVEALTTYAKGVAEGGAADAPVHFGTPEISQLGAAVGRMHTVLQARTDTLRSYADHVTHELKSPLTVIAGAAELLRDPAMAQADRAALLDRIEAATKRMNALLEAQHALAQAQEPMPTGTCRLSDVSQGAQVIRDGVLPINGDAMRLVMAHLVGNAKAHGATQVTAEFAGDTVVVSDNGSGISDGNRDRIFDPFFTTRRDAGGTGMGLAIVSRMLAAQGASIALGEGSGATFVITV